ncbi:MAG: sensor histidine kinase [Myxococcota bacterium]
MTYSQRPPASQRTRRALAVGATSGSTHHEGSALAQARAALVTETERRVHAEELCRALRKRSLEAREDEQRRIARDLHDQVGQALTALKLAIAGGRRAVMKTEVAAARLSEAERACAELERGLAEVAERLRPAALDRLGLSAAVEQLVSNWALRTGVKIELEIHGLGERLPEEIETVVYRIVQEALTNIARHAQATHVSVVLQRTAEHAIVSVEDNGVGFSPNQIAAGHFGLIGMRERIALCRGTLEIVSSPGEGVSILSRIPLARPASALNECDDEETDIVKHTA